MKKIIAWPFVTLLTLIILSFALTNRQDIVLGLFPFPGNVTLPVFVPLAVIGILGLLAGLAIGWINMLTLRGGLRRLEKDNRQLTQDLDALRRSMSTAIPPARQISPAPQTMTIPEEVRP